MLFALLGLAAASLLGAGGPGGAPWASWVSAPIVFRPHDRAVSNWRWEAARHVEASSGVAAGILLGRDPPQVSRCVRLNNYWCIKRAGWTGEIAADNEGHVAFASASEGADVAALLLRRYYVADGRHSALAIVSHWAPATCGFAAGPATPGGGARRAAADSLATRGIARTLRARFLAAHGRRVVGGRAARGIRSVVADPLIGRSMPALNIAVRFAKKPITDLVALPSLAEETAAILFGPRHQGADADRSPGLRCAGDDARIRNYARTIATAVSVAPTGDLNLFDANGRPTPNLARVMRAMSGVEIGPLGATASLVTAAVAHVAPIAAGPVSPGGAPIAAR